MLEVFLKSQQLTSMEEIDLVTSLIPAIKQQLDSPETPFVKDTYNRILKLEEVDEDEALKMLALCLADESNRMFLDKRGFDIKRYRQLLSELPELPE